MSKIQREEKEITTYIFPEYTDMELKELNKLLDEKYNGGKTPDDEIQWLKDSGGLNKYGAVITTNFRYEVRYLPNGESYSYAVCDYPTKYLILKDKLAKAVKLQSKKEWAIKKDLERLDENMKIINETIVF